MADGDGYQIYSRDPADPRQEWPPYLTVITDPGEAKSMLSIARHRHANLGWDWKLMRVSALEEDS